MDVKKTFQFSVLMISISAALFSCKTYEKIPYFKDISDTSKPVSAKLQNFSYPLIQPDDILLISILTLDEKSNALFAAGNTVVSAIGSSSSTTSLGNQVTAGHMVDKEGNIELPIVGIIHVQGMTTFQAKEQIKQKVKDLYKEATVDVRYNNFKITVMGEVLRPATYTIPNEKINLLDALGMAGDMTIYGKRDNVLLIRDSAGTKNMVRLNLNSKDIISSPYFWLKQSDVIYVEPDKSKAASLDMAKTRNYALAASLLSLLIVIATRVNY
ncbi:MAG TPA: polysaccharide biosynthesis/export family protein [Panacibacter sp.]|nr:polysaccharide biosynthesis/export family protein [Panacibacter sp.]HNP46634.1 polysaccharide biosynthesis/export family protein [Panacibacter sp.]